MMQSSYTTRGMRKYKQYASCALIAFCLIYCIPSCFPSPVTHAAKSVAGVSVHVVTVDLSASSALPQVQVAVGFPAMAENFSSFLKRSKPSVAVTGTYFCKRTLKPVGDIIINGQEVNFGGMGTAMCVTPDGGIAFNDVDWGHHMDYSNCTTVLAAGPRLVRDGEVWVNPQAQGFSDPHVLGNANRIGVGITSSNKLVIAVVRSSISLEKMGSIMKQLGALQAMGLDAGASIALYVNGKIIVGPSRKLVNLLIIPGNAGSTAPPASATTIATAPDETETEEEKPPQQIPNKTNKNKKKQTTDKNKLKKKTVSTPTVTTEPSPEQKAWISFQNAEKLFKQGKTDPSVEAYKNAVYFAPENASYAKALASAYEKSGREQEASTAYVMTGKIYYNKEMMNEAVTFYSKAVSLSQKNIEAHKGLAAAYKALGKNAEAAQELKTAEALSVESVTVASLEDLEEEMQEETPANVEEATPAETLPVEAEVTEGISLEEQVQKEEQKEEEETLKMKKLEEETQEPETKFPSRFTGDYNEGTYTENNFKFSLVLPEGWAYEDAQDAPVMKMRDMDNPYFATIQVMPLKKDLTPREFEEKFMSGMYKKKAVDRDRTLAGEDAYEVVYDELINDRVWGSRYVYVRHNNMMFILSMTTYAERYEDAAPSFKEIIESFLFSK